MANESNLKFITRENASEFGRRGGEVSAKRRKVFKTLRDNLKNKLIDNPQIADDILNALIREARKGNIKAIDLFREILGEKTKDFQAMLSNTVREVYITKNEIDAVHAHINAVIAAPDLPKPST